MPERNLPECVFRSSRASQKERNPGAWRLPIILSNGTHATLGIAFDSKHKQAFDSKHQQGLTYPSLDIETTPSQLIASIRAMSKILALPPRNRGVSFRVKKRSQQRNLPYRGIFSSLQSNMPCMLPSQQPTGSINEGPTDSPKDSK